MEEKTKDKFITLMVATVGVFMLACAAADIWLWDCGGCVAVRDALTALGVM